MACRHGPWHQTHPGHFSAWSWTLEGISLSCGASTYPSTKWEQPVLPLTEAKSRPSVVILFRPPEPGKAGTITGSILVVGTSVLVR